MIDWTPELININIKIFWTLSFLGYWPLGKLLAAGPSVTTTASPKRKATAKGLPTTHFTPRRRRRRRRRWTYK